METGNVIPGASVVTANVDTPINGLDLDGVSLREAVFFAAPGATITFDSHLSGQTVTLTQGQIVLGKNVTIDASPLAKGIQINGNGTFRIFELTNSTSVVLHALTLTNGNVSNGDTGMGGAILLRSGASLDLLRCTLAGNVADAGGAIFAELGSVALSLRQCTLQGNSAIFRGAIGERCPLVLLECTVSGNTASSDGGGVYHLGPSMKLTNCIVAGNSPNNFAGNPFVGANNLTNGVPLLAPLGDYGGPTPTMVPLPGSPAIDSGVATGLTSEQRGYARRSGLQVDIGAVEMQVMSGINQPTLVNPVRSATGGAETFQFAFTNLSSADFLVLTTTNVGLPWSNWIPRGYAVETPAGSGDYQFTDRPATNEPQRFYRVVAATGTALEALIHRWTFNDGAANDSVGTAHGSLYNGATISGGQLRLDGVNDYFRTGPIAETLSARTLMAWVTLSNLTQQAGSALTLENPTDDDVFDGIIYGEQVSSRWMNGSELALRWNAYASTVASPVETSLGQVWIAIVYGDPASSPGTIKIYRDGVLYADYTPVYPRITYPAGVADVLIGVRHSDRVGDIGTPDGIDAFLSGSVNEARIYNRALNATEISALANPVQ